MFKPTRRMGLAATTVAVGATTLFATDASAFTERDDILIDEVGYDVAGDGFTNGAPDEPATIIWNYSTTFGSLPELVAKIHFDGVTNCAQVVLVSFHDGQEIGRETSDVECPATAGHHARNVLLGGDNLSGEPGSDEVKVVLQTEPSPGNFVNAGSQRTTFGPLLDTDEVQIERAEFDLGAGVFSGGAPTGSATVRWDLRDNGMMSANLTGTLYAKNADDACVNVQVRYKDADGDVLETRDGDVHCLTDDDLHEFPVNNGANFEAYALSQVTYALMKDGVQIGATTVELGDGFIIAGGPIGLP